MNWLITGGCGFIGSRLARLLIENGHTVRVFDDLSVGSVDDLVKSTGYSSSDISKVCNWDHRLEFFEGSILDEKLVVEATNGAEVIVHLAANTGVGPSVEDPMADCRTNVIGTLNSLEAARENEVGKFVFASSGAPLGEQVPPVHEEMAPRPASPYGASKLAGEGYCSAYQRCFNLDTVALRFGNVYGPGCHRKQSVVAKFIANALRGETLEIYGDGAQSRDFIYIDDLCRAIVAAGQSSAASGHVFQIASSRETTVSEIVDVIRDVISEQNISLPTVTNTSKRTGDILRMYSDTSKARDLLSWVPEVHLKSGIEKTLSYYLQLNKN
jgi:UDP-glucose 4-epimerase